MKSIPVCHPNKKYGAHGKCVICYNKSLKESHPEYKKRCQESSARARNKPEGLRARDNSLLKSRYGIRIEDKEAMLLAQKGLCKLCAKPKKLVVEHNHKTGHVRGMVCNGCNIIVRVLESKQDLLASAKNFIAAEFTK